MREYAGNVFRSVVKGTNIMTPEWLGYGWSGDFAYELTKGTGLTNEVIYGVTVVSADRIRRNDLSKLCHSLSEARTYISSLNGLK